MLEQWCGLEVVVHIIHLAQRVQEDATGLPVIDKEKGTTYWTRSPFIPDDDGKMHMIVIDEFGHANVGLQQMMYPFVLDRALGGYRLPKHNRIILATNTREDQGGDNKMLKPFENRLGHVTAEDDPTGMYQKGLLWGWDRRLLAYLDKKPGQWHNVSQTDPAFPTPRSIETINDILKELGPDAPKAHIENALLAFVGDGFAREFITFLNHLSANLPRMHEIRDNPLTAKVPPDPHYQQIVAAAVAKNIDAANVKQFAKYLARLIPEARSMAANEVISRDPSLKSVKELASLVHGLD
jgi:hypothetical protein